jgi:hypothetical protein
VLDWVRERATGVASATLGDLWRGWVHCDAMVAVDGDGWPWQVAPAAAGTGPGSACSDRP